MIITLKRRAAVPRLAASLRSYPASNDFIEVGRASNCV